MPWTIPLYIADGEGTGSTVAGIPAGDREHPARRRPPFPAVARPSEPEARVAMAARVSLQLVVDVKISFNLAACSVSIQVRCANPHDTPISRRDILTLDLATEEIQNGGEIWNGLRSAPTQAATSLRGFAESRLGTRNGRICG